MVFHKTLINQFFSVCMVIFPGGGQWKRQPCTCIVKYPGGSCHKRHVLVETSTWDNPVYLGLHTLLAPAQHPLLWNTTWHQIMVPYLHVASQNLVIIKKAPHKPLIWEPNEVGFSLIVTVAVNWGRVELGQAGASLYTTKWCHTGGTRRLLTWCLLQ